VDDSARAFGWVTWPFRIVADREFAQVWADRFELRKEVDRRLRRLGSVPHSTVQLLWADFGAGKSHTLRYIESKCLAETDRRLIPLYTDVPVGPEGFADLYRGLVAALPSWLLEDLSRVVGSGLARRTTTAGARDLRQALRLIGSSDAVGQAVARDWMLASPGVPHLRTLKAYGIGSRIEDAGRVVELVAELVALVRDIRKDASIVWLVDEFQRVADVPLKRRDTFAKSIVSLFNSCPSGLHFVLSFSVAQQSIALDLMPPDLRSRASTFPMLTIPQMTKGDCLAFSIDLFGAFRAKPITEREHPFEPDGLEALIDDLLATTESGVTPRLLMERLEAVLFELYDASDGAPKQPVDRASTVQVISRIRDRQENSQ